MTFSTSQNNFLIRHEYRDFYSDIQRNTERIGDVGKKSDEFIDRAYNQFKDHNFHDLAKNQDSFIAPDEMYGTRGRDKNRNLNRMEYDMPERHDGKEHAEVMKGVNKKIDLSDPNKTVEENVKKIMAVLKPKGGYTTCSAASAVDSKPIETKDIADQIKM